MPFVANAKWNIGRNINRCVNSSLKRWKQKNPIIPNNHSLCLIIESFSTPSVLHFNSTFVIVSIILFNKFVYETSFSRSHRCLTSVDGEHATVTVANERTTTMNLRTCECESEKQNRSLSRSVCLRHELFDVRRHRINRSPVVPVAQRRKHRFFLYRMQRSPVTLYRKGSNSMICRMMFCLAFSVI